MRSFASINGKNKGTVNKNGSKTKKIAPNEPLKAKTNDSISIKEHKELQPQHQLPTKPEIANKIKKTPPKTQFITFNEAENNTQNAKPSGTEKQTDKIVNRTFNSISLDRNKSIISFCGLVLLDIFNSLILSKNRHVFNLLIFFKLKISFFIDSLKLQLVIEYYLLNLVIIQLVPSKFP